MTIFGKTTYLSLFFKFVLSERLGVGLRNLKLLKMFLLIMSL